MGAQLNRILVPLDESEQARAAYSFALKLAEKSSAEVVIAHAVEPPLVLYDRPEFAEVLLDVTREGEAKWQEKLAELAADAPAGVRVRGEVAVGPAAVLLVELMESEKPDLIISGSHGVGGMKMVMGSVSRKLLASANAPLLLFREIPPAVMAGIPEIVAAVDDSPDSRRALDMAQHLAVALGAKLHLVHVIDTYLPSYGTIDTAAVIDQVRRRGEQILAEARDRIVAPIEQVSEQLSEGDPGDELTKICKERRPIMVACGTRGLHGVAGLFIGSVARDLVNHTEVPVLVARHGEED